MKHIHTEGPGSILKSRFARGVFPLMAALFAFALAAPEARADVLVYEGFHSQDYTTTTATELKAKNPTGHNTGFSSDHAWSANTAVPKTVAGSLTLGASFDISETNGTGRAIMNNGGTEGKGRGIYRKFTASMPAGGSVYFRFLMKLNSDASHYTGALQSGGYWAGGFVQNTFSGGSDAMQSLTTDGIWMGYKKVGSAISLFGRIGSTDYVFPYTTSDSTLSTWATYIFIARVDIGKGTDGKDLVSLAVQPIATGVFSPAWDWSVKNIEANIVSGGTPVSYIAFAGQYQTNDKEVAIDQFKIATSLSEVCNRAAETRPEIGAISLTRTGAAEYSLSATEDANAADIAWIANNGSTATTNGWVTVAEGGTANWTISDLATDTTYEISALATNENGTAEATAGTLYTGMLMLDASSATDAYEYGSVTGGVTVARATGDPFPLTVNYTISGSAGTEGTTWAAPVAVTIPANETSAVLPVVPLMDGDVTSDVTITVALASGNYELPASNAATLTLFNLAAPAGKKTWVATANGNASDGANWSPSGAPTAADEILFDGNFSNARCIWDAAATHTVAAWEQASTFTGTIELQTTYESGAFAALAITGNCTINGGIMTQTANSNAQTYRLSLTVGGDLSVASGTQITATGKGYASGYPNGVTAGTHGGSVTAWSQVYGDFRNPTDIGAGGGSSGLTGGGAIRIVVTGTATVDGQLLARPSASDKEYHIFGAGGSICVSASSISGSGSINASGYGSQHGGRAGGGGGRVALFVTGADSMAFPLSKVTATGTVGAWNTSGGAGTVFVKTRQQANGTLVVDDVTVTQTEYRQYLHTRHAATPIPPGETWTLDELRFRNSGILVVPEGTTLSVPLAAISATSDRTAGILYEGGTINFTDVQPGGPYALTGKWVFQASVPYTFDGDVTISGNAAIGGLRMSGTFNDFATCDVTVQGNLNVASDGWLFADNAGLAGGASGFTTGPARHGGQMAGSSDNICYDSVFNPSLPAVNSTSAHEKESPGGGVVKLTVNGALTLDGKATARGTVLFKGAGSGGTINITAQTLSGSGSVSASGNVGNIAWDNGYNGAGGRIAVRVMGEDIGTTGIWTKFTAQGVVTNQVNEYWKVNVDRIQNTSAGTIYLQGKSDGEKGGTIYVRNQKNYDTSNVATWIPAAERGDAAADFANAKLVIADRGVVAIGAAKMKFTELTIEENSLLDLHGEYVRVKRATVGGTRLAGGKYTAATLPQFLADSGEGGVLDIGGGLSIVVR